MAKVGKILIAGGGIGGMAAALALLRRGFEVDVFEQAPKLGEVGAGVQISPNGARALDELGVLGVLRELSCKPERKEFRLWNSGDAWPMFNFDDKAAEQYGYPYLTVYRPDLLGALVDGVKTHEKGRIHLGRRVADLEQDTDGVTLILEDGETARGDVLLGADGVKSVIRDRLWNTEPPRFSGMITWRGVIPMERLPEHMQKMVGSTWTGPGGHVVNYPLRAGKLMNFVGTIERDDWQVESWYTEGSAEECAKDFEGWHADVQAMIETAPTLLKWALMEREPLQQWTLGRVTLAGDACHATLPFLAQGAVMSIEDGVVLGRCLEQFDDPFEALRRYEAARVGRTTRMVRGARDNTDRFHSSELATKEEAQAYLEREWSQSPIRDRYHWLYNYDVMATAI
ncbi:FAD-dependent monooxygenase [Antarcticimicrobium luteum]|uniref:Monooxygenase n=1 Tax=Antarcticimicrobium luteum TaxID=2547397 RepID=A0A4R5V1K0_9RHOB|nr:FAD-dependent monooxygenase [Antarcticimicrobium luteum]TDK45668.1 monooxygenase [Antarcticimicrobium luteum]